MNTQLVLNGARIGMLAAAGAAVGGCQIMDPPAPIASRHASPLIANAPVALASSAETSESLADDGPYFDRPAPRAPIAQVAPARPTPRLASPNVSRVTFSEEGADFDPSVSRDGERLVFASTQHRATADIYVKRANSKVVTQLTTDPAEDVMPAVSPDGQRIAFASNRTGNWDIFVMPITGGQAVQVTSDPSDELHPSWSPDGKELVYCRLGEMSGRWEMWVTDATNSATSNFIGYGLFPQWCPVGGTGQDGADRIAFQLSRDRGKRTFGLWTLDYKQGTAVNSTEIAGSSDSALINPTWSPDGKWIAYAEVPSGADQGAHTASRLPANASIWMINVDGTGKVNLASGAGASLMPVWGPEHKLYFVSNRGGAENIWSMDLKGALLAATGVNPTSPTVAEVHDPASKEPHHAPHE